MNELRIDVADLLTHPSARRAISLEATVDGLADGATGAPTHGTGPGAAVIVAPVRLDLVMERVSDGIVTRGTVRAHYDAECSTCLRPVGGDLEVVVSELYEHAPVDGETYPIEGHVLDLGQLVVDSLLLELPIAPHCPAGDPACAPQPLPESLVADADDDDAPGAPTDPRWAVLSQLEL
jgi:uncharacterized protein